MGKHSRSGSTHRKKAPRAAKKRLPPAQSEAIYEQAVAWLKANLSSSGDPQYTAALRQFPGLTYHTLRRRFLNLHRSHQHAHENQMLLTHAQEAVLVEWMEKDAQEAYPWSQVKLKVRVQELCGRLPSDEWIAAFCRRHPDKLRFRGTSGIDPKRAQCFNPGTVRDHFEKFGKICENYRVILNFDETGRQKGGGRKRNGKKFFTAAGDRARYKARDANLELITVIECCATDGTMLDPGFIFAGSGNYTAEWFEGQEGRQISVGLTGNGWTNDEQCLHWFDNVLAPQARAKTLSEDERVLLVFDGHHSHLTDELIDLGTKWRIDFYLLPSHTTHKLQPLDVGCFGPMQLRWVQRCEALVEETGQALERGRIVAEYLAIRDASITPEIVMAAWRKTGLHPFNPNVFQDSDFAPSRPYSTQAHLPASYPVVPDVLEHATPTETPASTQALDASTLESPTNTRATTTSPGDVNAPGPSAAVPQPDPAHGVQDSGASEPVSSSDHRDRSPSPMDIDDPLSPMDVDEPPSESTSTVDVLDATAAALSQFLPLPGPHFPQFHRTPISSSATESEQIEVLTADLSLLHDLYRSEFERRQRAESHCAHAAKVIIVLKARIAEKDAKKKSKAKRFTSKAKFLMGPKAMVEQQRSKQEKLTKVREDAEKRERQAGKDEEQRQRREKLVNDANTVFSGALKGKKKCDLQAIAFLLGLPFERKCEDLCSSIQDCLLQDRTKYQSNPRFTNLYPALDRLNAPAVAATTSQPDDSHAASDVSQDVILPCPPLPTPCSFPQPAPSSSLGAPPPPRHDENIPPLRGAVSAPEAAPSARQYGARPPLAPMVSQPQYLARASNFSYNAVAGPSSHTSMYYTP